MGDHSRHRHHDHDHDRNHNHSRDRSNATDLYGIIGMSFKACKSLVNKLSFDNKHSPTANQEAAKFKDLDDSYKIAKSKVKEDKSKRGEKPSKREKQDRLSVDDNVFSRQFSFLSKSSSRRSHTPTPTPTYLSKSSSRSSSTNFKFSLSRTFSRKSLAEDDILEQQQQQQQKQQQKRSASVSRASTLSRSGSRKGMSETEKSFSRSTSRRSTTPLVFSQSTARRKPPPVEKPLECTLEELCYGGVKKINIVKDVITDEGIIVKQEETLSININPGWTKGTKVTFEGKGDEKPGYLPADVVFSVQEQRHQLFRRNGDDLEIKVEIPLVKALTGCSLSVPLLGGESMSIYVSDIIYPGYEKVIQGQGMPNAKLEKRGDLRITFYVMFPTKLTNEQRSEARSILEGCS